MYEAQRILRYTIPGFNTVFILLVVFLATDFTCTEQILWDVKGIGPALLVVLGSGALGFLLANIYYSLVWSQLFRRWLAYDHRPVLVELLKAELIEIDGPHNITDDQRKAWELMNCLYNSHKVALLNEKYDDFMAGLSNYMAGLGATIVGVFVVCVTWSALFYGPMCHDIGDHPLKDIVVYASFVMILWILGAAFHRTLVSAKRISNSMVKEYVQRTFTKHNPLKLVFCEDGSSMVQDQ